MKEENQISYSNFKKQFLHFTNVIFGKWWSSAKYAENGNTFFYTVWTECKTLHTLQNKYFFENFFKKNIGSIFSWITC